MFPTAKPARNGFERFSGIARCGVRDEKFVLSIWEYISQAVTLLGFISKFEGHSRTLMQQSVYS